ncbi:hypothetical protein, partial [Buttiauxella gaviniae]|uniref:hypothetical protein n=1 Tax=Buttiauxella gaviniae TaxID=82990 RepID=UPI000AA87828
RGVTVTVGGHRLVRAVHRHRDGGIFQGLTVRAGDRQRGGRGADTVSQWLCRRGRCCARGGTRQVLGGRMGQGH